MDQKGFDRIVSITQASKAWFQELKATRELIREWPHLKAYPSRTARIEAYLAWEKRMADHVQRYHGPRN